MVQIGNRGSQSAGLAVIFGQVERMLFASCELLTVARAKPVRFPDRFDLFQFPLALNLALALL